MKGGAVFDVLRVHDEVNCLIAFGGKDRESTKTRKERGEIMRSLFQHCFAGRHGRRAMQCTESVFLALSAQTSVLVEQVAAVLDGGIRSLMFGPPGGERRNYERQPHQVTDAEPRKHDAVSHSQIR